MQMSREFFLNTNCKKFIRRICVKFSANARKGKPAVNFLREEFLNRNHPETYQEDFRLICYSLDRPALSAVAHLFNMSISLPSSPRSISLPPFVSLSVSPPALPPSRTQPFRFPYLFPLSIFITISEASILSFLRKLS